MAPSTRNTDRITTPSKRTNGCEADTPKKSAFYRAYDTRDASQSIRSLARDFQVANSTALNWLHDREINGSPAYRHIRRRSDKLGRRSQVSAETCKMLVSPSRNPIRTQTYEAQIEYYNIPIKKCALCTQFAKYTNGGQKYKMAFVKKKVSKKNTSNRTIYGKKHYWETVDSLWQYIVFTDEAHIDPSSFRVGEILRERGHRYDLENIQQRSQKSGVKLHIAAWINWHAKAEKLRFYHDEEEYIQKPPRPRKPRKRKTETNKEFADRIMEWEAQIHHDQNVKLQGNAMTQEYYTENLLPDYCEIVTKLRNIRDPWAFPWSLQEDGDLSHGMRKVGLAQKLKFHWWIPNFDYPAQSPDLNPMEAIWNILKQRMRRRIWETEEELKEVLQDEWSKITMQEVRARISDMPRRCKLLVKTGGLPIKSVQW
jgi:hypothetical protein